MDSDNFHNIDSYFVLMAKIITALTAVFFVIGLCYSIGIDNGFGINSTQSSYEITTLVGFFSSFRIIPELLKSMLFALISMWYIIFFGILAGVLAGMLSNNESIKKHVNLSSKKTANKVADFFNTMAYIFLVFAALTSLSLASINVGKKSAAEIITQLGEFGCKATISGEPGWSICSEIIIDGKVILRGYQIYKRVDEVAYITANEQNLVIQKIPQSAAIKRVLASENLKTLN
ncbi:hypothetical protein [Pseudoalteromonas tunicata]|nr:hypothetical protein [Pseudoalteromonas tunicata]ATC94731.1 hypothetical protein PTUN_a2215 [Pseudoalteromonas tunicata]